LYAQTNHGSEIGKVFFGDDRCTTLSKLISKIFFPESVPVARRFRKKRPQWKPQPLTVPMILEWADAHFRRTGQWPVKDSGPIVSTFGAEKWANVHACLLRGGRGLSGRITLAQLLERERGVTNRKNQPRLTHKVILNWADAYHQRTGDWPIQRSGRIAESPEHTWLSVDAALRVGSRGLPGGDSLAALLARKRGARKKRNLPRFTITLILQWADAYRRRTGHWPRHLSGPIPEAPGETWLAVEMALRQGIRGLQRRSTLFQLLQKYRSAKVSA